jgi:ribosome-associated toxin RatA of RatAB toxin-antitoxin module
MRLRFAMLASIVFCGPAWAQNYQGAPTVRAEAEKGASAASVHAAMDVAAPPHIIWSTLMDCQHATDFMPKVISCKTLSKDPAGQWEEREQRLKGNFLKPVMRNVYRMTYEKDRSLAFHRIAGDFKRSDGGWKITPIDGGKGSHVTYEIHVAVDGPVPVSMVRSSIAKGMPESMLALRRECVARAAKS